MLILQLILIQTIIFGAVIFILKKLMWGDTESAVNRLQESYSDINKKKEELVAKVQQIEQEYQRRKEEAEKVAAQIRDEVEKEMHEKRDEILKHSKEEAEQVVAEAMSMKDKIREDIKKEEQLKMLDYCEDILQGVFKESMRDKIDGILIEDFLKEVKGLDMSHVPPNITDIEIITCRELDDKLKSNIEDIIRKSLKREFKMKEMLDDKILGGIILKFGSLVLDGSLAGKFKEDISERKQKLEEGT